MGSVTHPYQFSEEEITKLRELRGKGHNIKMLSELMGYHHKVIRRHLHQLGLINKMSVGTISGVRLVARSSAPGAREKSDDA